ncbi:MAG: TM2 domain-containing protein [Bacteroidetes bacterium]|nr:TM2 domain-containing protein [Bacteroidota bacterium]
MLKQIAVGIFIFFIVLKVRSNNEFLLKADTIFISASFETYSNKIDKHRPSPIVQFFYKRKQSNKKLIAAALAFPLPFGIVGLHRIYLGTAPHVPVVYVATIGGVFGILPFIDFCILILDKDVTRYNNNDKVFMWVNNGE